MRSIIIIISFLSLISQVSMAQNHTDKEIKEVHLKETDTRMHEDSVFGYRVSIPEWLTVMDTGSDNLWGGVFPPIGEIKNAVMIKVFEKSEFDSFDDFKKTYITGNRFGKPTLFNKNKLWYGHNERDLHDIKNGVSCRVFTMYQGKIYHNQFSLIETTKGYLWIQFTATPNTYSVNLPKFAEFVDSIELIE